MLVAASCRSGPAPPPRAISLARTYAAGAAAQNPAPPGVVWQGLSEVYHESLVSRAPEAMRFPLRLPAHPWLDLSIGTLEDRPVTFRVSAVLGASSQFGEPSTMLMLSRTLTRANRWEPLAIDLSPVAGQKATLILEVTAEAGAPDAAAPPAQRAAGLWGSPVVRDGSRPLPIGAPQGVIFVWADGLRLEQLGAYGSTRGASPQLDRLGREGTVFDACVDPASKVSVATNAAERYRAAGYATVAYASMPPAGKDEPRRGFEEFHAPESLPDSRSSKTARDYVDRLLPWLTAHRDVPFFVFLHVSDPRAESDGAIYGMDAEIGRLVERLGTLGLTEKTLLVITGGLDQDRTPAPLIVHRPGSIARAGRVSEEVQLPLVLQGGTKTLE
jgi:hypothetical protein